MTFQVRHWNRLKLPTRHLLICEDDLDCQVRLVTSMRRLLEPQGDAVVTCVSGGMAAAGVIGWTSVDLVILDHDMPHGNGADLMGWLTSSGRQVPVITASGIPANNDALMRLGASHAFTKEQVISGDADALIRHYLRLV